MNFVAVRLTVSFQFLRARLFYRAFSYFFFYPRTDLILRFLLASRVKHLIRKVPFLTCKFLIESLRLRQYHHIPALISSLQYNKLRLCPNLAYKVSLINFVLLDIAKSSSPDYLVLPKLACAFSVDNIHKATPLRLYDLLNLYHQVNHMFSPGYLGILQAISANSMKGTDSSSNIYDLVELDYTWFMSIGHYALLDSFIKGILLKLIPINKVSFKPSKELGVSNNLLFERYKKVCIDNNIYDSHSCQSSSASVLSISMWPNIKNEFVVNMVFSNQIQSEWTSLGFENFAILSPDELVNCKNTIDIELGRPISRFFTIHVRQPFFKSDPKGTPMSFRNSDAFMYYNVIDQCALDDDLFVVLGDPRDIPVPASLNTSIFDYPRSKLKSELFDLYFATQTSLHIGNLSGISHVPASFGRPTLIADAYCLIFPIFENTIYLPRKISFKKHYISFASFYADHPFTIWPYDELLACIHYNLNQLNFDELFSSIYSFLDVAREQNFETKATINCSSVEYSLDLDRLGIASNILIEKSFFCKNSLLFSSYPS